ncbi:hypothetical protein TNCV_4787341 [Trichonephila clavipes]|nr:hypothetical protein TNCV_4787341 [Trichonephila clavipes]
MTSRYLCAQARLHHKIEDAPICDAVSRVAVGAVETQRGVANYRPVPIDFILCELSLVLDLQSRLSILMVNQKVLKKHMTSGKGFSFWSRYPTDARSNPSLFKKR